MPDPLPWDRVPPTRHAELDRVSPWLEALRHASGGRIATNQDFVWLREDIARMKAQQANPVVSLNEKQRREEKAQDEARAEARKKQRSSRPAQHEIQYEITVNNADQPGLPQPLAAGARSSRADDLASALESPDHGPPGKDHEHAADTTLEEAQHILVDYIRLLNTNTDSSVARHSQDRKGSAF
jgi:carboxyl-terminal processing protease